MSYWKEPPNSLKSSSSVGGLFVKCWRTFWIIWKPFRNSSEHSWPHWCRNYIVRKDGSKWLWINNLDIIKRTDGWSPINVRRTFHFGDHPLSTEISPFSTMFNASDTSRNINQCRQALLKLWLLHDCSYWDDGRQYPSGENFWVVFLFEFEKLSQKCQAVIMHFKKSFSAIQDYHYDVTKRTGWTSEFSEMRWMTLHNVFWRVSVNCTAYSICQSSWKINQCGRMLFKVPLLQHSSVGTIDVSSLIGRVLNLCFDFEKLSQHFQSVMMQFK